MRERACGRNGRWDNGEMNEERKWVYGHGEMGVRM